MIEELKMVGEITLTSMTPDGEICGEWKSNNTLCIAGLNDLVGAIAYSAVEDVAANIGLQETPITPIYGAIGGATILTTTAISGSLSTTPTTLAVSNNTGFFSSGVVVLSHSSSFYVVTYTGTNAASTTMNGTGSGTSTTLVVNSTTGFSSTGIITVVGSGGNLIFTYTGLSGGTTFTGLTLISGTSSWTISTNAVVSQYTLTNCTLSTGSVTVTNGDVVTAALGPIAVQSQVTTGSPNIVQTGTATNPYNGVRVGDYAVDVLGDLPTGTTVTAIDITSTNVTLSNNSTGTSTTN